MYIDDLDNMSDIDVLLGEIKIKIAEQVSETNKETIDRLTKENSDLKEMNRKLSIAAQRAIGRFVFL